MGVNLIAHEETTGSTDYLAITPGAHDYLVLGFTAAYYAGGGSATRGSPSIGGTAFTAIDAENVGGEGYDLSVYSWYFLNPTPSASPVLITTGTKSTGSDMYSVFYSLNNASFKASNSESGMLSYSIKTGYFDKFGGRLFGMVGLAGYAPGMNRYPSSWTELDEGFIDATDWHFQTYNRRHSGIYIKRDEAGLTFGGTYPCCSVQIVVDSVENSFLR